MSDVVLSTTESVTTVTVVDDIVQVAVTTNPVTVTTQTAGVQGASYNFGDPIYVTVRNATGATLTKGTIVYTAGAQGNHTLVQKANASGDATSARTLGWVSADIANNSDGFVIVEGYLDGIDTDHIAEGSQLYLSGTVAGSFTATKPQAPVHLVYVGVVTKSNPGNGRVLVKVQNGYELEELHDVKITSPVNNQVLTYDSATDLWINATNPADGVTSITAVSPLTGGTITSTGSIGLDQTALSITQSQVSNLVSDLAGKANLAGGNAFTGAQTISTGGTANKGLVVQGVASQAVNLFEVQDSTGAFRVRVNQVGNSTFAGNILSQNNATFTPFSAATVPLAVQGAVSQTANLQEWRDSNAFPVALVNPFGAAAFGTNSVLGRLTVSTGSTGTIGQVIRAVASQSANLQEWQDSAGTILTRISPIGQVVSNSQAFFGSGAASILNTRLNVATGSSSVVGQVIRGASGQSANLQEWQDSFGNIHSGIAATGFGWFGGSSSAGGQLGITAEAATNRGLVLKGAVSQTADILQIQNSSAQVKGYFKDNGDGQFGAIGLGQVAPFSTYGGAILSVNTDAIGHKGIVVRGVSGQTADYLQIQNDAGTNFLSVNSAGSLLFGSGSGSFLSGANGRVNVQLSGDNIGVTVRAFATQTADLLQFQTNTGSYAGGFERAGALNIQPAAALNGYSLMARAASASVVPVMVRGAASQSAVLQSWQNSAGTELMNVNSAGLLNMTRAIILTQTNAGEVGIRVRGAASQTGNLQEWQDSSANILARVQSNGVINGAEVRTNNTLGVLREVASGGNLYMARATSLPSNPGANIGTLYFRDGTNAGTLKLCVRAGAAGAETTILDNIPT